MKRIAIVGGGPAAAAAALGVADSGTPDVHITMLDIGRELGSSASREYSRHPMEWDIGHYKEVHKQIRSRTPGWVPEKSFWGDFPSKYEKGHIYRSDTFGGLSKFWGASFLPFTREDLNEWPVHEPEMSAYYKRILKEVPVTGMHDGLSNYFSDELFNQSPIQVPEEFVWLESAVNARDGFIAGAPRLAMHTSGNNACSYCGHCFYGCYNYSIYSADQTITRLAEENRLWYKRSQRVVSYSAAHGTVSLTVVDTESGLQSEQTYDMVFLAAGCLETTRIIAESEGLLGHPFPILENPMYQVPVVLHGKPSTSSLREIVALNNLLIGKLPDSEIEHYVHMQLYPLNRYLWNHGLSKALGSLGYRFSPLAQSIAGHHVFMMLFYLNGKYTADSRLLFGPNGSMSVEFTSDRNALRQAKNALRRLSSALGGTKFTVLTKLMSPLSPGGSYHYAATIPMGRTGLSVGSTCEFRKNIFINDSSAFPSLPSQNHSFTIMANSYRIAFEAMAT